MRSDDSEVGDQLKVQARGPGRWTADLSRPDAAVLMGLGVNAVLDDLSERRVLAVTTHFLVPAHPGPVEITVGHIDRTTAHTTTDARIQQAGRVIARILLTTATGSDLAPDR